MQLIFQAAEGSSRERGTGIPVSPQAQGPLERLREIALTLEQQPQAHSSSSPWVAIQICNGILSDEWSLEDHFESDGRRFLVARQVRSEHARVALSARERQIVSHVIQGHSNKLMALELNLTPSTVATYLRRVLTKLRLRSRGELIRSIHAGDLAGLVEPAPSTG